CDPLARHFVEDGLVLLLNPAFIGGVAAGEESAVSEIHDTDAEVLADGHGAGRVAGVGPAAARVLRGVFHDGLTEVEADAVLLESPVGADEMRYFSSVTGAVGNASVLHIGILDVTAERGGARRRIDAARPGLQLVGNEPQVVE